ncbi:hypothetical protein ACET9E_11735 [Aeromonas caviae]|uniref:hypothetical protein n=1 Tax=Aeromonas caviae TaxID=648 RepID=UPI0038CF9AE5
MAVVLVASNVVTAAATIDVNVIVPCSLSIRMVWKRCLTPLTSAYRLWAIIRAGAHFVDILTKE